MSKLKVMLEIFFDSSGIVHLEFVPQGASVNKNLHKDILRVYTIQFVVRVLSFGAAIIDCSYKTTPIHIGMCLSKKSCQDNSSSFCHILRTHLISHQAFLSHYRLKEKSLRGRRIHSAEEIVTATGETVCDIPVTAFRRYFQQLYQRWQSSIVVNGEYFEGVNYSVKVSVKKNRSDKNSTRT